MDGSCLITMLLFFVSIAGDKFYEVMFYFSLYVLRKVMIRDHCHGRFIIPVIHVFTDEFFDGRFLCGN